MGGHDGIGIAHQRGLVTRAAHANRNGAPEAGDMGWTRHRIESNKVLGAWSSVMASFAVVLPAAGRSSRFRDKEKKPFANLDGRAVWLRTAELFITRSDVVH